MTVKYTFEMVDYVGTHSAYKDLFKFMCDEGYTYHDFKDYGEDVWIPENEIYEKAFKVIETAKIKPLNEIEQIAAKLYDYLLKTELGEDGFNMGYSEDQQFYGYKIVDKPLGDKQDFYHEASDENDNPIEIPEEFKYIDHEYCYQWLNGGYESDDFAGELYFPLPNGQYLECHYEV